MKAIIGWFIFPLLASAAWLMFAGAFSGVLKGMAWLENPLVIAFYLSSLLFTIPANCFTIVATIVSYRQKQSGRQLWKWTATAGCVNFAISMLWIGLILMNDWFITA